MTELDRGAVVDASRSFYWPPPRPEGHVRIGACSDLFGKGKRLLFTCRRKTRGAFRESDGKGLLTPPVMDWLRSEIVMTCVLLPAQQTLIEISDQDWIHGNQINAHLSGSELGVPW